MEGQFIEEWIDLLEYDDTDDTSLDINVEETVDNLWVRFQQLVYQCYPYPSLDVGEIISELLSV